MILVRTDFHSGPENSRFAIEIPRVKGMRADGTCIQRGRIGTQPIVSSGTYEQRMGEFEIALREGRGADYALNVIVVEVDIRALDAKIRIFVECKRIVE